MTSPDPTETLRQINVAREQSYQNIALVQAQLTLATQAADAAARDRAAIQAIAQQTVTVDTSVGTRVFAGDVMVHGDTGWRKVNEWASPGWDFSQHSRNGFYVRRVGGSVQFTLIGNCTLVDSYVTVVLPTGWIPHTAGGIRYYQIGTVNGAGTIRALSTISAGSRLQIEGTRVDGMLVHGQTEWSTQDAWPTSLPGTPA